MTQEQNVFIPTFHSGTSLYQLERVQAFQNTEVLHFHIASAQTQKFSKHCRVCFCLKKKKKHIIFVFGCPKLFVFTTEPYPVLVECKNPEMSVNCECGWVQICGKNPVYEFY